MFKNAEELRELIRQGKTNQEIINAQLAYLKSDEYRSTKRETLKENETDMIIFHEGYINPEMRVAFVGNMVTDILYYHDDNEIYNIVIDLIRNNMDKKGFSINYMMRIIRDYFYSNEKSPYKDLYDFYKEVIPNNPHFLRENLPYILTNYKCSNWQGNITEFGKAYLYNIIYKTTGNEDYKEMSEIYNKSLDWDKLDEIGDIELNLSEIKGAGLAACTEYAFLEQNILSFMGFDTYMVGGKIINENGRDEAHNFNVVKKSDGTFEIIDTAQITKQPLPNISSPEELIDLENIEAKNGNGKTIYYYIGSQKKIGIKR